MTKVQMTIGEIVDKLKSLNKGDFIWVVSDKSLFKTYSRSCGDKSYEYLGYDPGDADADYDDSMHCIEIASVPLVSKPMKMVLVGKFTNTRFESSDVGYVFSSELYYADKGNYRIGQHILIPYNTLFMYNNKDFYLNSLQFMDKSSLNVEDVFFTEEDCIAECRKRNNKISRRINFINKTVNSMNRQLKDFMTSELYIDHEEAVKKDLKAGVKDSI